MHLARILLAGEMAIACDLVVSVYRHSSLSIVEIASAADTSSPHSEFLLNESPVVEIQFDLRLLLEGSARYDQWHLRARSS
jgi:hypothetical protein